MSQFQLLWMVLLAMALGAAQLGCEGEPSSEYRTYAETQKAPDPSTGRKFRETAAEDVENDPEQAVLAEEAAPPLSDQADQPIEPELAPDPVARDEPPEILAVASFGVANGVDESDTVEGDAASDPETRREADSPETDDTATGDTAETTRPERADVASDGSEADTSKTSSEPRQIELLVPEKTFQTEGPENALRVSYDDVDLLKVLNMDPVPEDAVSYFPDWLNELDGQRIRIRGFMYPAFQETGLTAFVLARDNQICCFGRNPKIYDLIEVTMRPGVTTNYIQGRPFDVVGVFHIRPEVDQGELYQLYQIDDAIVIDR